MLKEIEYSKLDTLAKNVSEQVTVNAFQALMKTKFNGSITIDQNIFKLRFFF